VIRESDALIVQEIPFFVQKVPIDSKNLLNIGNIFVFATTQAKVCLLLHKKTAKFRHIAK